MWSALKNLWRLKLAPFIQRFWIGITTVGVILGLLGFSLNSGLDSLKRSYQKDRKFRILVPLYAGTNEFLSYIGGKEINEYSRKVSRDTKIALDAAWQAWNSVAENKHVLDEKVDFYYFPEGYDAASYESAFRKAMLVAEKEGREVVGAIGNITSTSAKAYGHFYGENGVFFGPNGEYKQEKGLPVILPLATASDLPSYLEGTCKVPAVLRLPPSNRKQTELIAKFLEQEKAFRAILVKDPSNPAYSDDIIQNMRDSYVRLPFDAKINPFAVEHGRIVAVLRGGEDGNAILDPVISELKIDAFVLAGMTEFSVEALAQACASRLSARLTIFTDGTIDDHLLPRLNRLVADQHSLKSKPIGTNVKSLKIPQAGRVYLMFPLEEPYPVAVRQEIGTKDVNGQLKMTHTRYVLDSAYLLLDFLKKSLEQSDISLLSLRNIKDREVSVRQAIINEMHAKKDFSFTAPISGDHRQYNMSDNLEGNYEYHLFFADLKGIGKGQSNQLSVEWSHDYDRCPAKQHVTNQR